MKKILFLFLGIAFLVMGCPGPHVVKTFTPSTGTQNDTQKNNAVHTGSYEGTYKATEWKNLYDDAEIAALKNGNWSITIDESGIFKGKFGETVISGTVDRSSNLSGVFLITEATTDISGNVGGNKISGKYSASSSKATFGSSIKGTFTGVKKIGSDTETSLTLNNQSSKTLINITYGGKVYEQKLAQGHSYKFELDGDANGYIFFEFYDPLYHDSLDPYSPKPPKYRTKEVIIIKKGEQKTFIFTDTTLHEQS